MGRIALFVFAVGGLVYLLLDVVLGRLSGLSLNPVTSASTAIIVAVVAWTVIVWFAGDRLGRRGDPGRNGGEPDAESDAGRSTDSRPEKE